MTTHWLRKWAELDKENNMKIDREPPRFETGRPRPMRAELAEAVKTAALTVALVTLLIFILIMA